MLSRLQSLLPCFSTDRAALTGGLGEGVQDLLPQLGAWASAWSSSGKAVAIASHENPKALPLLKAHLTRQRQPGNQRGEWGVGAPACPSGIHYWFAQSESHPSLLWASVSHPDSMQMWASILWQHVIACVCRALAPLGRKGTCVNRAGGMICLSDALCGRHGPRLKPWCCRNNVGSVCPAGSHLLLCCTHLWSHPVFSAWGWGVPGQRLILQETVMTHFRNSNWEKPNLIAKTKKYQVRFFNSPTV
jgi:hypothetical protein